MRGTAFEQRLDDYHYFSYNVNEALHTTEGEKQLLWQLMWMIRRFILGDVVRSVSGESPTQVIQRFLIGRAKSLLVSGLTATQTSDTLGFEYPPALHPLLQEACRPPALELYLLAEDERKVI